MRKPLLTLLAISAITAPFTAQAAVENYIIEKPHTQILFFANHLGFSHSLGKFTDHEGTLKFDTENPAQSSVEITIPTSSLTLNDEKWDAHLKNADFFNVEEHPNMTFKSTAIEVTGEKTAKITGDLTLLGVTKPVTLDTTFNHAGKHAFSGKYVAGFSATANIKRSEFGMKYGLPLIGDDVEIRLEVEAIRQEEAKAE
tara:strand:- start:159 stop:755 length:597 start_codon:yes stop_codon:yes gene_type:complete